MRRVKFTWSKVVAVAAALLIVGLLGGRWWLNVARVPPVPVAEEAIAHAQDAAARLRIVDPLPLDEYDRDFFGPAWQRVEPQLCDTRNEVLQEWLSDVIIAAPHECSVESGWFVDPYTGHYIEFLRGPETSKEVHVDHVVALADAWRKGAAEWSPPQAQEFANDPLNLIPTQGWVNEAKGADDAASWMPHNEGFWCSFAVQQVLVKDKYDLGVTDAEVAKLLAALDTCE